MSTLDELIAHTEFKTTVFENETYYRELLEVLLNFKRLSNQAPVGEFVTLFSTPRGTTEFLGRVPDRKLCDLKEGDLLYKQEIPSTSQLPWLKVIDETLVVHHIGVADASDTYEQAKEKINLLLCMQQSIIDETNAQKKDLVELKT
jgi:hypothetical protein